jgi:hypothetical protein
VAASATPQNSTTLTDVTGYRAHNSSVVSEFRWSSRRKIASIVVPHQASLHACSSQAPYWEPVVECRSQTDGLPTPSPARGWIVEYHCAAAARRTAPAVDSRAGLSTRGAGESKHSSDTQSISAVMRSGRRLNPAPAGKSASVKLACPVRRYAITAPRSAGQSAANQSKSASVSASQRFPDWQPDRALTGISSQNSPVMPSHICKIQILVKTASLARENY